MFGTIEGLGLLVPIFGLILVGWLFYIENENKKILNKEKSALIEKGIDPSFLDSKPKKQHDNLKAGLLLIGVAFGVFMGYILNINFEIPSFVSYPTMILVICGIVLIIFHRSTTD